jgi:chromatin segregation and condensation protein Rec8/ScpA/Scc1 (kleisin family)
VIVPGDIEDLAAIASRVFSTPMEEPDVDHLDLDLPSVQDAMVDLQGRMASMVTADFEAVVADCIRDVEVVAYFLALLELARWGIVRVEQTSPDATISIHYDEKEADRGFATMLNRDVVE